LILATNISFSRVRAFREGAFPALAAAKRAEPIDLSALLL